MNDRWRSTPRQWRGLKERVRELRREYTRSEQLLWQCLRGKRLGGIKFRRQHTIGPFIADFFAPSIGLVVEVDGRVHDHSSEHDRERTVFLKERGLRVIRFTNDQIDLNINAVLAEIERVAREQKNVRERSA